MFKLSARRYTGAKTKLLDKISNIFDKEVLQNQSLKAKFKKQELSFFDAFAGTGVVSELFTYKQGFKQILINDFLYSNFIIYQGFFTQAKYDETKLLDIKAKFNTLKNLKENYYSLHFANKFFSLKDALQIGFIRDELDRLLKESFINEKEFNILLASLLYSADRVANTVGHYDAYRKKVKLEDKFSFELIKPLKSDKEILIFNEESNALAKRLVKDKQSVDIAFLDPPYNSRQYSRFYHLLESLAKNDKPKLYGVALKREPENISEYSKTNAKEALKELLTSLVKISKCVMMTYNNTYNSKSSSSQNKIQLEQIIALLEAVGRVQIYESDFKPFSSGKTEFKEHKEMIFKVDI